MVYVVQWFVQFSGNAVQWFVQFSGLCSSVVHTVFQWFVQFSGS